LAQLLHPSVRLHLRRQFERLLDGRSSRFVERMPALWATHTEFSGSLTGVSVPGDAGQPKAIVVVVSTDKAHDDRRVLISPNKILSEIDARILEGVAIGVSTVQLAARLYLSRQGIEYHVGTMLRQFKVPNRAALVSKMYSMGLFGVGSWPPRVLDEYIRRR
jgi:DNA-binding CsgD family transcriptional regulator